MTLGLGHTPAGTEPSSDPQAKNVDKPAPPLGFQRVGWSANSVFETEKFSEIGYLGNGYRRKAALDRLVTDSVDRWLDSGKGKWLPKAPPDVRRDVTADVIAALPRALRPFLEAMSEARMRERAHAILDKVGWDGLNLIGVGPDELAQKASVKADGYWKKFPDRDDDGELINQQTEHKKGRCEKWHKRRLKKQQLRALLYVEAAVGAVGGADVPGRPLYVSDCSLDLYDQHVARTQEVLAGLRLVMRDDPTIQIPMLELNEKAKIADVTKRRLLIDMNLRRFAELGWHVCWITVTLPGEYVANSTNEDRRVSKWNTKLGPLEAMQAIQDDHHRVLALLRDRGVRPAGWWNAQPQQSGTPHRHYVLACRTVEDARAVCDGFKREFSTRLDGDDGEDRGCAAYVIGDNEGGYAPPRGKNGSEETAASIAKYAARYSTRYVSSKKADETESKDVEGLMDAEEGKEKSNDQERFTAWKTLRRVRGHTWIGLDSGRSPMELWDTLWANAQRSDYDPDDARMALALRMMRLCKAHSDAAVAARNSAKECGEGQEFNDALALAAAESDEAAHAAWHAAIALGMWPDADLDLAELEWLKNETSETEPDALPPMPLREARETVYGETRKATIGCIEAMRVFAMPRGTAADEILTLIDIAEDLNFRSAFEARIEGRCEKLDKEMLSRTAIRRIFLVTAKESGFGFSKRPNGTLAGFNLSGEILLHTKDKWLIVDEATAAKMVEDSKKPEFAENIRKREEERISSTIAVLDSEKIAGLSDNPTDPRESPPGFPVGHLNDQSSSPG